MTKLYQSVSKCKCIFSNYKTVHKATAFNKGRAILSILSAINAETIIIFKGRPGHNT